MKILSLNAVYKNFTSADSSVITVLADATYVFNKGESYAIQGISGSGKSTLLYMLAGLELPTSGAILFDEQNITLFSRKQRELYLQHMIGLLFQNPYLIDELSLYNNIMLRSRIAGIADVVAHTQALWLCEQMGIAHLLGRMPAELSGGQQQRVALARALMGNPSFILADELTAHLDEQTKQLVLGMLMVLQKKLGFGLIITTHDPEVALQLQHCIVLENGVLYDRTVETVFKK